MQAGSQPAPPSFSLSQSAPNKPHAQSSIFSADPYQPHRGQSETQQPQVEDRREQQKKNIRARSKTESAKRKRTSQREKPKQSDRRTPARIAPLHGTCPNCNLLLLNPEEESRTTGTELLQVPGLGGSLPAEGTWLRGAAPGALPLLPVRANAALSAARDSRALPSTASSFSSNFTACSRK